MLLYISKPFTTHVFIGHWMFTVTLCAGTSQMTYPTLSIQLTGKTSNEDQEDVIKIYLYNLKY